MAVATKEPMADRDEIRERRSTRDWPILVLGVCGAVLLILDGLEHANTVEVVMGSVLIAAATGWLATTRFWSVDDLRVWVGFLVASLGAALAGAWARTAQLGWPAAGWARAAYVTLAVICFAWLVQERRREDRRLAQQDTPETRGVPHQR